MEEIYIKDKKVKIEERSVKEIINENFSGEIKKAIKDIYKGDTYGKTW